MKPREAKPGRSGQDAVTIFLLFSSGRLENPFPQVSVPISAVPVLSPAQHWFGGGARGTRPILISLSWFLCVAERGAVVEGQKKPGGRSKKAPSKAGSWELPGGFPEREGRAPCRAQRGHLPFLCPSATARSIGV